MVGKQILNAVNSWITVFCSVFIIILLVSSCRAPQSNGNKVDNGVWMETDPIQCLGNPWEMDWLENNPSAGGNYPKGKPRIIENVESGIILAFFSGKGAVITDIKSEAYPKNTMVCDACTCTDGYTLYLYVNEENAPILKRFNFSLSERKDL